MIDAGAEARDQLEVGARALDERAIDAIGDGGDDDIGLLEGRDQVGLAERRIVGVEPRVEQLHHPRLDRLGELARDDDERLVTDHRY